MEYFYLTLPNTLDSSKMVLKITTADKSSKTKSMKECSKEAEEKEKETCAFVLTV